MDELTLQMNKNRDFPTSCVLCFTETWLCDAIPDSALQLGGFNLYRADRHTELSGKTKGGGICFYTNNSWCNDVKVLSQLCSPDLEAFIINCKPFYSPRDFNKGNLSHELPKYKQFIKCPTREGNVLDHCYTTISGAYRAVPRAALGQSDHIMVHLIPAYRQKLKLCKPVVRTSKKWTSEAVGELQGCLDCTDWDVFRSTTNSLDEYTDTVSSYIYFCEDSIIPTCTRLSPTQLHTSATPHPPPLTPLTIKEEEVNRLFKRLNTRKATGPDSISPSLLKHCANQLSPVFTDIFNTSLETCHVPACFKTSAIVPVPKKKKITGLNDYRPVALTSVVMKSFERLVLSYLKDITDPLLDPLQFAYRPCFSPLTPPATPLSPPPALRISEDDIFNRSLELCEVPACFKRSTIIPIPKKPKITGLNDYRPVALTSVVMKSFERLVLAYLKNITGPLLDPLQFAYRANSSAFNTIIPTLLQTKLTQLSVPSSICQWITSFLTDRHQLVKLGKFKSNSRTTSTGAPQGCVLSPLLFSLYTNDCTSTDPSIKLLKFADDTTVIGLIQDGDESAYRQEIEQLAAWCSRNNLELNTLKTVEMIVDFRRNTPALPPLTIMNSTVPTVASFRFLGTTISQDLKWDTHIDATIKKAQQRLYFLRQLRKFNLPQELLIHFYSAVIEANRSVDDAVNMALHFILQHLDSPGSYARILFVDFSSAFNTIIPALLRDKLFQLNVPDSMCSWITDFLTDRRQFVRLGTHVSDLQHISTGSPQGCVLSPLLFSLYTNGCTSGHQSVKLLKFADDPTLIGLISDGNESAYRGEIDRLVSWCSTNNLELNSLKTVEMTVDFRKDPAPRPPVILCDSPVSSAESFCFLGTTITKELKWAQNISYLTKKAQQRMYFLRQLKFLLPVKMLVNFYTAIIESVLTSSITVWFAAATARDKAKLQRVIHSAEKVIGCSLPSLQELYFSRSRRRAAKIAADPSHPGNELFRSLPSGKRLRSIKTRTSRHKNSFFPTAVSLLNSAPLAPR
ncbi:hypothetical protein QTP86_012769 [Hemibagrus guttatus]|nr:hypothetical protein QTP86_012769 [Hemibagrus guttatus]